MGVCGEYFSEVLTDVKWVSSAGVMWCLDFLDFQGGENSEACHRSSPGELGVFPCGSVSGGGF